MKALCCLGVAEHANVRIRPTATFLPPHRNSAFWSTSGGHAVAKRAQLLRNPPEEIKGQSIDLMVPVEFFMR